MLPNTQSSLASKWAKYHSERQGVLNRARECAALTIPALLPPENFTEAQDLYVPASSFGSNCVSNLASKLLLTLFPPNSTFFKLQIDEAMLQQMEIADAQMQAEEGANKVGLRAEAEKALRAQEKVITEELTTKAMRPKQFHALKLLIATGDALLYSPTKEKAKVYNLNNYCVKRGHKGDLLELVIREKISYVSLTADMQQQVTLINSGETYSPDTQLDLYTFVERVSKNKFKARQEIGNGIPWSKGDSTYTEETLPWLALRWMAIDGEDYGRGHVEESLGDFRSLEKYAQAINRLTSACSKIVPLVDPGGMTNLQKLNKAKDGEFVKGRKEDISFLYVDKMNDFGVIQTSLEATKNDLKRAFLMNSVVSRQAERVTAEEIRTLAGELEDHLGGVYSIQSQEFQYPLIALHYAQLKRSNKLPSTKDVKPVITAGLEALGRGNDSTKLRAFVQSLAELPEGMNYLNMADLVTRLGNSLDINMEGLVKSPEQIAQEKQERMDMMNQQKLMDFTKGAVPHVASAVMAAQQEGAEQPPTE